MKKAIFFFILFTTGVYAGVTGKLAGKVIDSETKKALPSANVFILDTRFGAATSDYGEYYVIQLPPGEYAVRAEMMGYRSVTFEEVRIKLDRTTIVNFELKPTMIEVPGITVIAERALIEHDVTASVRYASRDEIERTPNIEKSTELVRLQPGVTGSHIRSGRTSETVYYIDGVAVRHPIYGSTAALDLDVMAIKEMEMLTGGFNAEYGQAQSGVVNIITREGGKKLSGELLYKTDNLSPKDCSFNTDYAAFAFGGTLPFLPVDVRFFFSGSGSFTDGYLDNHRTREEREFMGIKYHDRQSNSTNFNLKLTYNISPNYKLSLGYRRGYQWYSPFNWSWKNLPDSTNNTYKMTSQGVLSFTHSLSENTFYSIHLGHLFTHSHDDLWGRTPPEFWHWEYYWQDTLWEYEWGNVWLLPDSTVIDSFVIDSIAIDSVIADSEYVSNTGWGNDINGDGFIDEGVYQYWSDDSSWVWTAKFDFTSQIHPRNLIKFGFNIDYEDILYTNIQYYGSFRSPGSERPGPYSEYGLYRWVFEHGHPWLGAVYLQDKIELPGLVVNIGGRIDYFTPGEAILGDTLYQKQWEKATGLEWELEPTFFFSPRLGISHPITERTTLYFNYGRFQQIPNLQFLFRDPWTGTWCGNPSLKPQKTIQYEFGFSHQFAPDLAAYIKLFNKDMYDYVGLMNVGMPPIWVWVNRGYGRARGIELELKKRYSQYTSGSVSYTYQNGVGYSSWEFMEYYEGWEWIPVRGTRLDWDRHHKIVANISIEASKGEHMFDRLPDRWRLDILWNLGSGLPYTPKDDPTLKNQGSRPFTSTVDVHLQKEFSIGKSNLQLFVDILNLWNNKNVNSVNPFTGEPYKYGDADGSSHKIYSWSRMQYLMDPGRLKAPRQIKLGIKFIF